MNYKRFELSPMTPEEMKKSEDRLDPRIVGTVGKRILNAAQGARKSLKAEQSKDGLDYAERMDKFFQDSAFEQVWREGGASELGQLVANSLTFSQVALGKNTGENGNTAMQDFLQENVQASTYEWDSILVKSLIASAKQQLGMSTETDGVESDNEKKQVMELLMERLIDDGFSYCAYNSLDRREIVLKSKYASSNFMQLVDGIEETLDIFDRYSRFQDDRYIDREANQLNLELCYSPDEIYEDALNSPSWLGAMIDQEENGGYKAWAERDYETAKSQMERFVDAAYLTKYGDEDEDEIVSIEDMSEYERNLMMQTFEKVWEFYALGKPEVALIPNKLRTAEKLRERVQERLEYADQQGMSLSGQVQLLLETRNESEFQNVLVGRSIGENGDVKFVSLPSFQPQKIKQYQSGETIASVDPLKLRETIFDDPTQLQVLSAQGKKLQYVEGIDETDLRFLQLDSEVQQELNSCYKNSMAARHYLKLKERASDGEYHDVTMSAQGFYLYRKKFFRILDQVSDFMGTDHYNFDENGNFLESDQLHLAMASRLALEDYPDRIIDRIGGVMRDNDLPDIAKEYLVLETLNPPENMVRERGSMLTRELYYGRNEGGDTRSTVMEKVDKEQGADGLRKMFYTDLLKCTFGSNGQEMEKYLDRLQTCDDLAQKVIFKEQDFWDLRSDERLMLVDFIEELNALWQQTQNGVGQVTEKPSYLDIDRHLQEAYERFKPNQRYSLVDRVVRSFTWPLGIRGVDDARAYLERIRMESDRRGRELAARIQADGGLKQIHKGDFVKVVQRPSYLPNILQNGILCHEMLGSGIDMDATPFDADFSEILNDADLRTGLTYTNAAKYASLRGDYGDTGFFVVIERSRIDDELQWSDEYDEGEDREWIYRDNEYDKDRYEIFRRDEFVRDVDIEFLGLKRDEYNMLPREEFPDVSIRTGVPADHISYLVVNPEDHAMRFKVMYGVKKNSFYIPVVDYDGNLLLTPEEYDRAKEEK